VFDRPLRRPHLVIRSSLAIGGVLLLLVVLLMPAAAAATGPAASAPQCSVGSPGASSANGIAYDPSNQLMYVSDADLQTIAVVSATCTVVATIHTPSSSNGPSSVVFDPSNNLVYVSAFLADEVYYISNQTQLGTVHGTFNDPTGLAYDPSDREVWVTDDGSHNASLIQNTSVVGTVDVGNCPWGVAYSPYKNSMVVANYCIDKATVIGASSDRITSRIRVGTNPVAIAYDPNDHHTYVTNSGSDNVSVIDPNGSVITTIHVGHEPWGAAYDLTTHEIFVTNGMSNSISVLSSKSVVQILHTPTNSGPLAVAWSGVNGKMYVVGLYSGTVYVEH